jgi:Leucine-rich repeat (LRR) protein
VHDIPRQQLHDIIVKYGDKLLDDPRRCRALLMDYCGEYKGEINLVYLALQEKVAHELRSASPYLPKGLLYGRLTKHLQDAYYFTEDVARWAVETCAYALDMPEADLELRVFKSEFSTTVMSRSWSTPFAEWSEIGTTPGTVEVVPDHEVRLIANVDDIILQKLVKECNRFGPIQDVDFSYSPLTDLGLKRLASLQGLTALDISGSQITDAGLAYLVVHKDLENLNLSWCESVTNDAMKHLYALNRLKSLFLERCVQITDEALTTIGSIRSIEYLNCAATGITDAGIDALRRLFRLQRLVLDETNISGEGLSKLVDVRRLAELSLFHCVRLSNSGLASLRTLDFLSSLNLGDCGQIVDQGLVHVRSLRGLTNLCLEGTAITDTGLRYIQELVALANLDLGWTAVTDEGVARLHPLVGLKSLTLSGTRITDESLVLLNQFQDLAYLDLSNTHISDKGLGALAHQLDLIELNLESTKISDAGLEHLKHLRNLSTLFLGGTQITDNGLELLAKFPGLKYVDVTQCAAVTETGLSELKSAGIQTD